SDMAEDEIQANMALMAFSDSEVSNDKSCSKTCLQNYEALKKQYDDLLVKLDDTAFKASTYKRGLSILEAQVVKYKESEVLFSEEIALLKRSVGHKDYLMGLVKTELEKVKEEKEGFEFKLAKFEKSSKDLDNLLASQVTDKNKRGFGYTAVPSPHPLILNRPTPLDLSYSGLEEFKQPEVNEYGPRDSGLKSTNVCNRESNNSKENTDDSLTQQPKTVVSPLKVDKDWREKFFHPANHVRVEEPKKARENTDAPIIEDWVSDDEEEVESIPKVEKKADVPTATKKESVKTVESSRRTVRYAEMYRSQRPRGNHRSWNGHKSSQLGCNFVFNNKACFICGNFDHIQYNCPNAYKHMVPRAVLMKTGLKTVKNAKSLSTARSINTVRPVSTARFVNTVRSYNTAHPKPIVSCARPKTHFQNQAQRSFYKNTALTKRSNIQNINSAKQVFNTVRPNVNTVRTRGFNAVKPSACWSNYQLNEKGFVDSGCSRHMSGNIAHLSDFKEFDGGFVTFGGGANGGRITGKGTIKTDKLDFEDVYFVKELKFNLFSVSQMCDKKNYVLFTDSECLVLSLGEFCREKGIKREYSVARTPQQNGVAERKNRTLIEAARTMLADSKLPTTFWAEAVSTACYVQNRVLVVKPHNKTPYELFRGIKPAIGFMKPFGCHVSQFYTLVSCASLMAKVKKVPLLGMQEGSKSNISSQKRSRVYFQSPSGKDASYFEDITSICGDDNYKEIFLSNKKMTDFLILNEVFLSAIYDGKTQPWNLHTSLFGLLLSQEEPKRVSKALKRSC
ncbi:ribonuclease H-like domain-containing protein, partial [Tanacetum coccineum]